MKGGASGPSHSKNNLSTTAYYSNKPPLSSGNGKDRVGTVQVQARLGSHDGKARLN